MFYVYMPQNCYLGFSGFFGTGSNFFWWRQVGKPVM